MPCISYSFVFCRESERGNAEHDEGAKDDVIIVSS